MAANLFRILGRKTETSDLSLTKKDNLFSDKSNANKDVLLAAKQELTRLDNNFNIDNFLEGAKKAFKMIVSSYKAGNIELIKDLVSTNVYDAFSNSLTKDEDFNTQKYEIIVKKADIVDIQIVQKLAKIKVKFLSLQRKEAKIKKDNTSDVKDVWTFEKHLDNTNPIWILNEVNADE